MIEKCLEFYKSSLATGSNFNLKINIKNVKNRAEYSGPNANFLELFKIAYIEPDSGKTGMWN